MTTEDVAPLSQTDAPSYVLGRLVLPVYLPTMASTLAVAALIPVLPVYLPEVGLSLRMVSVVLAALGVGATLGGLPAGALIARFGERRTMFGALVVVALTTSLLGVATAVLALVALRLATGAATIAHRLSRQTYITRRVPTLMRGRAMASIGGSFRVALFVGPFVGGLLVDLIGFDATFAVVGGLALIGLVPPLLQPETPPMPEAERADGEPGGVVAGIRRSWRVLVRVGAVPVLVMAVREGRFFVLPLIARDLGLSLTEVGALVAIGTGADLLLFPVAGFVMDRFGRLAAMIPSFTLIAIGLAMLGASDSAVTVAVAGVIMGVGNGLSSGTMLTLGSDLAPAQSPGPFLAAIAVVQDTGKILGPLIAGFVASAAGLDTASFVLAGLMVVVIVYLVAVVGETSTQTS